MNPATQMSEENTSLRSQSAAAADDGTGNVDKIRDILFGGQMRDYESRFRRLEENLVREAAEIREMTRQRLDALEEYIKKEFEAQSQRLKSERDERTTHLDQYGRDMRDLGQNLTRRITETNDMAAEAHRSIRQEILSRSTSLFQEMQTKHQESAANVERYVNELRDAKADRATIASLLTEMAMRLTGEFKLPGKD